MAQSLLNDILEKMGALDENQRKAFDREILDKSKDYIWVPNPGPQTDAFNCQADELYFGGEAGGGKSDLLCGLALVRHKNSLILRRIREDARALAERTAEIVGHNDGLNRTLLQWRMPDRTLDFGGCLNEDDKQSYKGKPHDLIGFDEAADFSETQFEFISIWCRSADPNQRCRIVCASNPPLTAEGLWLVKRWAAWLDKKHPNPAKTGEIRWYFRGEDDIEREVEGPGPYPKFNRMIKATSRTFIRSRLSDNPDLDQSDYGDKLTHLTSDLREVYAEGKFSVGLRDHPRQVIPTAWVDAAQKRWTERPPLNYPMTAMGVDASGGGKDPMVVAPRYDTWYAPLIEVPGKDLPPEAMGKYSTGIIVANRKDNAAVILDMGGGYGGPTYEHLTDNAIEVIGFNGAETTLQRTKDRRLGFFNVRAAAHWKFREALDPDQEGGSPIALPSDQILLADLAAPTFDVPARGIRIEPKEDLIKRLGRSTDRGDAVIMSWWAGNSLLGGSRVSKRNRKPVVITKRSRGHRQRR